MSVKKKLTRKEMLNQPDELISGFNKLLQFIDRNKSLIHWAMAAVLLIIVAAVAHVVYHGNKENQAVILEAEALKAYQGGTGNQNMTEKKPDYKTAQLKYQEIVDNYSGTDSARRALVYLADCSYNLKEYAKAEKLYQRYLAEYPKQDSWYLQALNSLAYTQEEAGKYMEAADNYRKVIDLTPDEKHKQIISLDLARAYKLGKAWDKEIQVYENMLKSTDNPEQMEILNERLSQAKSRMADKGGVKNEGQ